MGYPGIRWDPDGPPVSVQVFRSLDLPAAWPRIDEFEGVDYRRILVPVAVDDGLLVANIYQVEAR
jgi:hypothetical protein